MLEPRVMLADVGNTLAAAYDTGIREIVLTHASTQDLGDGPAGDADIDMFHLRLQRGDKVTITTSQTASTPLTDTVLRLFNSAGIDIGYNDNANGTAYAEIADLTITATGDYYVGVSGVGNTFYDPSTNTGAFSGATGTYDLLITLTPAPATDVGDRLLASVDTGIYNVTQGNASPPPVHSFTTTGVMGDGAHGGKDVDFFRFEGHAGDLVTVNTDVPAGGAPTNTMLRLFGTTGFEIAFDDDDSGRGDPFARLRSVVLPTDGTYYVGVSGQYNRFYDPNVPGSGFEEGAIGDYSLMIVVGDVGDTQGSAAWLRNLDGPFGAVTGSYSSVETLTDDSAQGGDRYKIPLNGGFNLDASISLPEGGQAGNVVMELINEATGKHVAFASGPTPALHFENRYTVENYYLRVSAAGEPGDYKIDIDVTNDDAGADIGSAADTGITPGGNASVFEDRLMFLGDNNSGTFFTSANPKRDVDMFRFEVAAGETITATTFQARSDAFYQPVANTLLFLFDAAGQAIDSANNNGGNGFEVLRHTFASGGVYYLGVSGAPNSSYSATDESQDGFDGSQGEYGLRIARDVPDQIALAQPTGAGPDDNLYIISGMLGDGPAGARDVDMYAFNAFAGGSVTVRTVKLDGGEADARLRIFDALGHELAIDIGAGGQDLGGGTTLDAQVVHTFQKTGTYYVGVSGEGNAVYDPTQVNSGIFDGAAGAYNLRVYVQSPAGDDGGGVNFGDFGNLQRDPATEPRRDPGDDSDSALDTGIVNAGVFSYADFLHAQITDPGQNGEHLSVTNSDQDFYRFNAPAGAIVTVEFLPTGGGSQPIALIASLEGSSYDSLVSGPAGSFTHVLTQSGDHYLRIRSNDTFNSFGDYRVRISVDDGQNSVTGTKFDDLNGNALRDAGEPGLPNVRVFVDQNNDGLWQPGEPSDLTDANGLYSITGLAAGPKILREVVPAGYVQTAPGAPLVYAVVRDTTPPGAIFAATGGRIEAYDAAGNLVRVIDDPIFDTGLLSDLEIGPDGGFYVGIDTSAAFGDTGGAGVIVHFNSDGQFLTLIALPDDDEGNFASPRGFDVDREGNIWLAQVHASKVVAIDPFGSVIETITLDSGVFPVDVAVGPDGHVEVSTLAAGAQQGINYRQDGLFWRAIDFPANSNADYVELVGGGVSFLAPDPVDVQEDAAGNIWVTSFSQKTITRYSPAGLPLVTIPIHGNPDGIAVATGERLGSRYYQDGTPTDGGTISGIGFLDPIASVPLGGPNGNPSFESGLSQWETVGDVTVKTAAFGSAPTDGLAQVLLTTGPAAASHLDLNRALPRGDWFISELLWGYDEGSMLVREIIVDAADNENPATLSFDYNLLTNDVGNQIRGDQLFLVAGDLHLRLDNVSHAHNPSSTGYALETGTQTVSVVFNRPGAYRLAVGIVEAGDDSTPVDGAVLIDNFRLSHEGHAVADLGRPAHRFVLQPGEARTNVNFGNQGTNPAPTVTGVLTRGAAWTSPFTAFLDSANLGDVDGYAIPVGSGDQLAPLPWNNLNQVTLRFSEPVVVHQNDLILRGVNTLAYSFSGFTTGTAPDGSFQATWTLTAPIGVDKLLLSLADTVVDLSGNALDGEWINPTSRATPIGDSSAFASGDGAAGGAFNFRLNVVPGDTNQNNGVNVQDVVLVRNRQGSSAASPANYSIFSDINANAGVNVQDVILTRNQQGKSLPAGEPALPASAMSAHAFASALRIEAGAPPAARLTDASTHASTPSASSAGGSIGAFPPAASDTANLFRGWRLRAIDSGDGAADEADPLHRRRRAVRDLAEAHAASQPAVHREPSSEAPHA